MEQEERKTVKRTLVALAVMASALLLASGVALAATIDCPNRPDGSCIGTDGSDNMRGTPRADEMRGHFGHDTLRGFRGDDDLFGGIGDDTLFAGKRADKLSGGPGVDKLYGRAGNDRLGGGQDGDPDEFYCGPGTDHAIIEVGDLVATQAGDLVPVLTDTSENDLEAVTTCERITINILQ